MNISKRDIILSLIVSIALGILIICLFTEVSSTTEDTTVPTTEATIITEPSETIEETTEPTTLTIEEILFDSTISYYKFNDESILLNNIDKCNNYIALLQQEKLNYPNDIVLIDTEIERIVKIIEQYNYDLKFVNKGIFNVPEQYNARDFKSYESYKAITSKNSSHYKLQNQYAVTGPDGIRRVDDRFCISVGSYFTTKIGQYIDVVLENGTIIPCILGDQKSDRHTDALHIAHMSDGSIIEFIVDLSVLDDLPRKMGNISYVYPEWKSPVVQIIVYDVNFFDEVAQ